ncbi:MAG: DUF1330 domain-containing protein [Magnetococcales bacterium]|nr:DUF1330 domain-containing protein [Magnetococcales bacterium]
MSAYLVGHITVHDKPLWNRYVAGVAESLLPYKAELLFRGEKVKVLAGSHDRQNVVVIRFTDMQTLNSWFGSDTYQALIPLRDSAADVTLITYDQQ